MIIPLEVVGVGALVAVVASVIMITRAAERRRLQELEEHCLVRGYKFEPGRPEGERTLMHLHPLFDQGHGRKWGYTVSGGRDVPFTAFEYRWTTGGGKSQQTHTIAGVLWEAKEDRFPGGGFRLEPEGFFDKIGEWFGKQDFDFPDDPAFSAQYKLQGADEVKVRALFTPAVRGFLVGRGEHLAGAGKQLLWWRSGRFPRTDKLDLFFSDAELMRRTVWGGG